MSDRPAAEVAAAEPELYPSLGRQLVGVRPESKGWMQESLVHGPGAVSGQDYRPNLDQIAFIWSAYEVFPQGHERAGLRVHQKAVYERAKGTAKTEMGAGIGGAELCGGPVRCDGFDARGEPVGIGVLDPNIPFIANSLEQASDLAFTRAKVMIGEGPLADLVEIQERQILLADRDGRLYVTSSRAKTKDGGISTHYNGDEPHLATEEETHLLYETFDDNLNKRSNPGMPSVLLDGLRLAANADPWGLLTSTTFGIGEGSVLEELYLLYQQIERGEIRYPLRLLYDRVAASDHWDLDDDEQLREAIMEASGAARDFRDVERIVARFRSAPKKRWARRRRLWLNQIVKEARAWLDPDDIRQCELAGERIRRGDAITLGFDGSKSDDTTALVACRVSDGHLQVIKCWRRPPNAPREWRVPSDDVDATVKKTFRDYDVIVMRCDVDGWQDYIDAWAAEFNRDGREVVIKYDTRLEQRFSKDVERLGTAFGRHAVTHSGQQVLVEHLENARTRAIGTAAEKASDDPPVVLEKESGNSPLKIDCATGSVLAYGARGWALAKGLVRKRRSKRRRVKFH